MQLAHVRHRLRDVFRWHVQCPILDHLVRGDRGPALDTLAGWPIPAGLLGPDAVCYCCGVGEDLDFERQLIARCECTIHAFDRTPRAIAFVQRLGLDPQRFVFHAVGLWSSDTVMRFHAPLKESHVSHSIVENKGSGAYFDAPCRRIATLMAELNHDHLDLLKMNIEGAEQAVMTAMLHDEIRPRILTTTFEGPGAFGASRRWVGTLRAHGYLAIAFRRWKGTFVLRSAVG